MPSHEIEEQTFGSFGCWESFCFTFLIFDLDWFFAEKENHQTDIEYNHKMAYTKRLACKH